MSSRIALVTGGNKGIGYEICRALAKRAGIRVILASRNATLGADAQQALQRDNLSVDVVTLDVTNEQTISTAAAYIKSTYGGLDILVNNAGMAFKGSRFDEEVCRVTMATNFYGVLNVCRHMFPLLRPGARVVNVSSMTSRSTLNRLSPALREQFMDPALTLAQLEALVEQFCANVRDGVHKQNGWTESGYGTSKVAVSALTRIQARDNTIPGVLINCCCPGWVRTDMAGPNAPKSPEEGALTPVFVATLPADSTLRGLFFEDEKVVPYV